MRIGKSFRFDSAHFLPNVPEDHKCSNMHGHTYTVTLILDGPLDPKFGWVMDYGILGDIMKPILKLLDHRILNDVVSNPTAEMLCLFIRQAVVDAMLNLSIFETEDRVTLTVRVQETPNTFAEY